MQIIVSTSLTPEEYAQGKHPKQVKAPEHCPNCQHLKGLEGLGYYSRGITQSKAAVLVILVRRFFCRYCRITVSCLPAFAQPYRLVNTETIEAAFEGRKEGPEVQRWIRLIDTYWRCFKEHLPELVGRVGNFFGALPLSPGAQGVWEVWIKRCRSLGALSKELISRFSTCLFGTYHCHQSKPLHAK